MDYLKLNKIKSYLRGEELIKEEIEVLLDYLIEICPEKKALLESYELGTFKCPVCGRQ